MGNSSSSHTHEPLDKGFTRGTFGDVKNTKAASFRFSKRSPKKMDRLRRSFRDSFRRRKDRQPESSKPHQWQSDEQAVRAATCSFPVKYLGCVEVFESRGMQVCEEALKVLRNSRRRAIRGLLHVSGDGLRVVDDDTKGLIVDQTIEKVSFCAPDRNHERGFSYICRDGTTRRWMCHGFLANKDSGERLSHAVGCAFAVCLERKQRRDKECGVTMTFDMKNSTFTRSGSFRTQSITERLANNERGIDTPSALIPPQPKPHNPFAIERPHATPSMLERQGSFRAFNALGSQSPFKRQMSLRINDLPSNAERQKAFLDPTLGIPLDLKLGVAGGGGGICNDGHKIRSVSPIPEISPMQMDTVSQLCQELSQGLSLLTTRTDNDDINFNPLTTTTIHKNIIQSSVIVSSTSDGALLNSPPTSKSIIGSPTNSLGGTVGTSNYNNYNYNNNINNDYDSTIKVSPTKSITYDVNNIPIVASADAAGLSLDDIPVMNGESTSITTTTSITNIPTAQIIPRNRISGGLTSPTHQYKPLATTTTSNNDSINSNNSSSSGGGGGGIIITSGNQLPNADQWLGQIVRSTSPSPKRAPSIVMHGRAKSLSTTMKTVDPFDAEWAAGVAGGSSVKQSLGDSGNNRNTNPFISPPKPPAQSFQVQL